MAIIYRYTIWNKKIKKNHSKFCNKKLKGKKFVMSSDLLLLKVFVEHVEAQRTINNTFIQKITQIVGVSREFANGCGLVFNEFLFQIMGNLKHSF